MSTMKSSRAYLHTQLILTTRFADIAPRRICGYASLQKPSKHARHNELHLTDENME